MIDLVDKADLEQEPGEYQLTPLLPILDEFEVEIRRLLTGISKKELQDRLILEAKIYGELVQAMDKHGMRTYGLATAIKKYNKFLVVEVFRNTTSPHTIRVIKIPLS